MTCFAFGNSQGKRDHRFVAEARRAGCNPSIWKSTRILGLVSQKYLYDDAHRLTAIVDGLGNALQYTLDAAGNQTAVRTTDANGTQHAGLTRAFNPRGQLTRVDGLNATVFHASTTTSYDGNSNLLHSTDARGIARQSSYDALNRLVQTLDDYQGTDASTQNATMAYGYDVADRLTGIIDPDNLTTTAIFDGLGNLTRHASPDSGTTTSTYNAAGQIAQRTDANGVAASYSYDTLNRVTAKQFPDGKQNLAFFYDEPNTTTGCATSYPIGRLTRVSEIDVITTYCYDFQGRVIAKTQAAPPEPGERPIRDPIFGNCPPGRLCHHSAGTLATAADHADAPVSDTVRYTYTKAGRVQTLTYPGGLVATYLRDAAGRTTGIDLTARDGSQREAVQAVSYLPFGPIASLTLGNGQTITRNYDANYRLNDLTGPALNLHYQRDAAGNITAITEDSTRNTFVYDALGRLTSVKDSAGTVLESYTYNKTGDRLSKTGSGVATGDYGYQANTHWLTGTGNAARVHDAAGNTTGSSQAGGTLGLGYDHLNRLTVVQRDQQTLATYVYNAFGQRIGKITDSEGLRYAYNENSQLLMEYGGDTDKDYLWLDEVPVAVMDTHANDGSVSTVNYVHADGLNTPRAIADESGQTIWTWNLVGNPFGEQQPVSSTGYVYNLRFPGQYYDQETGWNYNVNRYFDPAIGGFTQVDPLGFAGGQSGLYPYGNNNPLSNTDPTGLQIAGTINNDNVDWSARAADNINLFGYLLTGTNIDQYTPGDGPIQSVSTPFEFMAAGGMARGVGAVRGMCSAAESTTSVGRWMSQAEYDAMAASGRVQESFSGTTHVASPADASAFINQAKPGSLYVEFNVPTSSLKATNAGWSKIIGPNSLEGRLAGRKGLPVPQMPNATNIVHSATRLP
jgi:RHS repeat-associated protein